jgi:arylsulfatase A-like enzyme
MAMMLLLLLLLIGAVYTDHAGAVALRPNILFLLQDDGGYNGLGYMNERLFPGKPRLHTPRLDALAAGAVKLTQFYTQPLCSPTRSAFLTGRYPIRLGTQATNPDWGKPWGVDLGERFLSQSLQDAGYVTALFGKW